MVSSNHVQNGHFNNSFLQRRRFLAIGLNQSVIDRFFTNTSSRVEGIGIDTIASEAKHRHMFAFSPRPDERALPLDPGDYQWRATGKASLQPYYHPQASEIYPLRDYEVFREYSNAVNDQSKEMYTLRGLMELSLMRTMLFPSRK